MMHDLTENTTLLDGLACAALEPGLRSILVFDAPYSGLQQIAALLAQMLTCATDLPIERTILSSAARDDDLWGYLPLPGSRDAATIAFANLFSPARNSDKLQLIIIPDLSRVSLVAARAAIMLIGADVAHLERHGQQERWQPRLCWLAACSSAEEQIGAISPHLLDRFALRLDWQDIAPQAVRSQQERIADLLTAMQPDSANADVPAPLAQEQCQRIRQARQRDVTVTPAALESITTYTADTEHYTPRREIALARLARTLARLRGHDELSAAHVERAARMLGLHTASQIPKADQQPSSALQIPPAPQFTLDPGAASLPPLPEPQLISPVPYQDDATTSPALLVPDPVQAAPFASDMLASWPYPEDSAPVVREAASLRMPARSSPLARSDNGPIIGVEQSETLEDLAIVSTILHAAMFRAVRQPSEDGRLRFLTSDLRRYRRGVVPEHMLMLLLDYTALRDCDWQEALLPYLHSAYTDRASIALVKVGGEDATHLLQAEIVSARSLLVPQISRAFDVQRGGATPLAHGLDLALQMLHKALQHGRSAVGQVTFVALTDGRGNVPLAASRHHEVTTIVTREGIEDALRVAGKIGALKRVKSVVLHPPLTACTDLPVRLAWALGGRCEVIPPYNDGWGAQ
jgi:magnesium chelatase subunit D